MSDLRSNLRSIAWLALFALAVQGIASFGHVHAEDITGSGRKLALRGCQTGTACAPAQDFPAPPSDQDDVCAICALMTLIGSSVLPTPPTIAPAIIQSRVWVPRPVTAILTEPTRSHFQARAPPT
jgi:hypothetical protein